MDGGECQLLQTYKNHIDETLDFSNVKELCCVTAIVFLFLIYTWDKHALSFRTTGPIRLWGMQAGSIKG